MATKSSFRTLAESYEDIVSTPATLSSLLLSNKTGEAVRASIRVRRGGEAYALFVDEIPPGQTVFVFKEKRDGINIEGSDSLEASASAANSIDIVCSYEETAGSQPLFNLDSWNNRAAWAAERGKPAGLALPNFVKMGLNAGASRWRNSCCYLNWVYDAIAALSPGWGGLELENYTEINADNGYLAACGVNLYVEGDGVLNSVSFDMQVNRFYESQLTDGEWNDVMTHEMGHGLGIGIFWTASSFFLSGSSYPAVQSAYNTIASLDRSKTPLESSGGGGTASAHWENNFRSSEGVSYYGVIDELMVGALVSEGMVLSNLSLGALKDFGYETFPSTEGYPRLAMSAGVRAQEKGLKCGLSSGNPEKMMRMLQRPALATDGKLTLRRYILT